MEFVGYICGHETNGTILSGNFNCNPVGITIFNFGSCLLLFFLFWALRII